MTKRRMTTEIRLEGERGREREGERRRGGGEEEIGGKKDGRRRGKEEVNERQFGELCRRP